MIKMRMTTLPPPRIFLVTMTNDTPVASPEPSASPLSSRNTSSISLPRLPGESLVSNSHHGVNYESDDGEALNTTSELLLDHHAARDDEKNPWKNPNVRLSLALCITQGIADSIWGAVVLSGFLYALGVAMGKQTSDNTLVGAAEAVQGMTQLLFALPIGYVADIYGKARIVRLWRCAYLCGRCHFTLLPLPMQSIPKTVSHMPFMPIDGSW